jgi:hypothetical protein
MATARIKAPDTIGTRAVKGHGRCHNTAPARATKPALVCTAHSGGPDVELDLRERRMFGNPNIPFLMMFDKSNITFPAKL